MIINLNFFLMFFWLVIAVGLLGRGYLFPEGALGPVEGMGANYGGIFALVMAAWNFARWTLQRTISRNRRTMERNPLAPRVDYHDERLPPKPEFNPELDFLKPPGLDQPSPSPNGDHK